MIEPKNKLPIKFIEKLKALFPSNNLELILKTFSEKSVLSLRINNLSTSKNEVVKELEKNNIRYQEVPWCENALLVKDLESKDITDLEAYKNGGIYIQSLSSMIPSLALDPKEGENILDIAAAPGSKTTQIADIMKNTGSIVANDISRTRMYKLKENLKNYHVTNTTLTYIHGEQIWRKYPEFFDRTLVDTPCSMEGRFKTFEKNSFKDWSPKKVKELSHRQKYLLRSAISATKVGGTIIYSTCTLSPEENEEVIDWILEKEKGKIHLEKISILGREAQEGLTSWKDKTFDKSLSLTLRISPTNEFEGFFVAKIKKTAQTTDLATYL